MKLIYKKSIITLVLAFIFLSTIHAQKKTDVKDIDYINVYGDYYIVKNDKYLYVFDKKYTEIISIDNIIIYENKNDYDIIYEDDAVMYYNDVYKGGKLEVEYYDLYTYKLIKKVLVNG